MHPEKRLGVKPRQASAGHGSHQQRPHQPRGRRGRDRVELGKANAALPHHLLNQSWQRLHMAPGCDLRHHPTPARMLLHLGGHSARQHPLIAHHSCS